MEKRCYMPRRKKEREEGRGISAIRSFVDDTSAAARGILEENRGSAGPRGLGISSRSPLYKYHTP